MLNVNINGQESMNFLTHLDEVQKSLCTTPDVGVGVHIYVKVLKSSYFLNHLIELAHSFYNVRYRSKVSDSNILPWPIGHKGQTLGHKVKS